MRQLPIADAQSRPGLLVYAGLGIGWGQPVAGETSALALGLEPSGTGHGRLWWQVWEPVELCHCLTGAVAWLLAALLSGTGLGWSRRLCRQGSAPGTEPPAVLGALVILPAR